MDCSTPGFPVLHNHPESAQTHVHWVSDAIQPSYPLSSPSPPAFSLSQHQGIFWWVSSSHQVAKVLELQLQHQSFQWLFRTDFFSDGLVGSPCSPGDSQECSPTPQFKSISPSVLSFLYSSTLSTLYTTTGKTITYIYIYTCIHIFLSESSRIHILFKCTWSILQAIKEISIILRRLKSYQTSFQTITLWA